MVTRVKGFHDIVEDTIGQEGPAATPRREADRVRSAMMQDAARWRSGDSVLLFFTLAIGLTAFVCFGVGFWVILNAVLEVFR